MMQVNDKGMSLGLTLPLQARITAFDQASFKFIPD